MLKLKFFCWPSKFWVGQQLLCWCWGFQRLSGDQSQSRLNNGKLKEYLVYCELVDNCCLIVKQKVKKKYLLKSYLQLQLTVASSISSAERRRHRRVLGSDAAGRAEGGEVHVALTDDTAGQNRRIKNEIVEVQSVQ